MVGQVQWLEREEERSQQLKEVVVGVFQVVCGGLY
jgi:hypothetical protein